MYACVLRGGEEEVKVYVCVWRWGNEGVCMSTFGMERRVRSRGGPDDLAHVVAASSAFLGTASTSGTTQLVLGGYASVCSCVCVEVCAYVCIWEM